MQQAIGYGSDRHALSNGTATVLRASTVSRATGTNIQPSEFQLSLILNFHDD
jgi:hypothetical protein